MVSLKKMKLRKPTFKILGKKGASKEEIIEIADEPKPTVEITPVENDPIMEDREDADESNATPSPAASVEEEKSEVDDEERSPPDEDDEEEMPVVKAGDDDSVMTEANEGDDALSTVKEEPSKEEAEAKAAEETAPPAEFPVEEEESGSLAQTMDEDLTLDATEASTLHETGCTTPVHAPAFCGCFGN
mmetsp:Transcript_27958/g.50585  ORF Transcript_27958/g.50585 Transcript_27958/m.50585 type:complete len:188 (-) Transcript_27958:182-745(-)|eukprot:CAMPEP_0201884766 /NCGR_PEP_ID=MMETSP0902-20130614/17543_1 /ASSEMBLY_ACC=CAM_ASM_000551 /TAXON_ID=420261 /ORGANISM="Thalassiosira antarctica, Strain CCMP982" /LENGTH=187 /DNA_ID=CAMNT_0048413773 /DNA_START=117 /DNA_END=680 /DNA_ORIENTATION=-